MSVHSKMTAIADPIRTLKGTSGKMGLDVMASNLGEVVNECDTQAELIAQIKEGLTGAEEYIGMTNDEVDTQTGLIQQIKTALADKAAGGVELPPLDDAVRAASSDMAVGKQLYDDAGNLVEGSMEAVDGINRYVSRVGIDGEGDFFVDFSFDETMSISGREMYYESAAELFGYATPDQVAKGATFTSDSGLHIEGNVEVLEDFSRHVDPEVDYDYALTLMHTFPKDVFVKAGYQLALTLSGDELGNAEPGDVRAGKTFTALNGMKMRGEALLPGGGSVYPDGAFAPVTSFTDGKQYALVATINGVRRYLNNTTFNNWTMNATEITIAESADDYVIFSASPVLFTAVASGNGFLLQNGSNYLSGNSDNGSALRVDSRQAVWTVDTSATAGLEEGKYLPKEDANAVWLFNNYSGYDWTIKFEENNNSFGFDRNGRDSNNSKGYVSFVLYEYVAGEGELNPIVDSSDANVTADKMLAGYSGYANGRKVEGNIQSRGAQTITPSTTAQEIPAGVYLEGKQTIAAIQTETKSVTENGTYTPSSGKYFSSFTVNVPSGGTSSAGLVVKSGTTTSATIATGLSSIEEFFIYKESQTATGLIHLHYSKTGGTSYLYASAWSTNTYGTKTITNATTAPTISGGSITLPSSSATSGGLSSGVTYKWIAIGKE